MNITLFLGAGFSAAFGLPVMNRFFDVARTHPRLNPNDRSFLEDIRIKARNAAGMVVSPTEDFEHVLSFAPMAQNTKHEHSFPNSYFKRPNSGKVHFSCFG
jgi:hypothetical protein